MYIFYRFFEVMSFFKVLRCINMQEGAFYGDEVTLSRIETEPQDRRDPSHNFKRLQFPVRLAYSLTINKAQGQSLNRVSVFLKMNWSQLKTST